MNKDHNLIWKNCLAVIKKEVPQQSYQTWFAPITPSRYAKNTLTISVPNQFFYEWLEGHYVDLLRRVIHQQLGPKACLAYQISQKNNNSNEKPLPKKRISSRSSLHLDPDLTFETFIVGDCNQLAYASAQAAANNPGKTAFNPLMFFAETGLGKTHIAKAILYLVHQQFPEKEIVYVPAEEFTAKFIEAIRKNQAQTFIKSYSTLDMLIVDDIHFLAGKEKTQEIFFHVFNHLHQSNKQIIMTSDCPPSELQGFQKRLLSRFKWGLTVSLQKPGLETRIAIIQNKMQKMKLELSDDIIHTIATNITTNVRELEGVLISLAAHAALNKKEVSQTLIQQTIESVVGQTTLETKLTFKYLQKVVTDYYKVSIEAIKSKSRKKDIVVPRQLIMYLCRKHTNKTFASIGRLLGNRDHSTINYGDKTIKKLIQHDKKFRSEVEKIESIIRRDMPATR